MNKEGKNLNGKSVNPSNKKRKTLITGLLIGGAILGAFLYSCKKSRDSKQDVKNEPSKYPNEVNSVDDKQEIDYNDGAQLLEELKSKLIDDFIFGSKDIIIVRNNSDDNDLDEIHSSYALVEYMESSEKFDGYVGVTLKLNDTLYSSKRTELVSDPTHEKLRWLVRELKESNASYSKVSFSSKALGFYFETEDGNYGENLKYTELRSLESISGFRYIEFRFFHCENDNGLNFIKEFLKLLHPNGGEEDNNFDIMPIIMSFTDEGIRQYEGNNITDKYLRP